MEKLKIYLDTNIIHSWFRNHMESKKKGEKFTEPKILNFIFSLENEYIVSNITKTEIFRYLSAEWNVEEEKCDKIWETFLDSYNVTYLEVKEVDFNEITKICLTIKTKKKTLVNLVHLQTAKKEDLWFLSGEDPLVEKYKKYYDKILLYKDLRKIFSD